MIMGAMWGLISYDVNMDGWSDYNSNSETSGGELEKWNPVF